MPANAAILLPRVGVDTGGDPERRDVDAPRRIDAAEVA